MQQMKERETKKDDDYGSDGWLLLQTIPINKKFIKRVVARWTIPSTVFVIG